MDDESRVRYSCSRYPQELYLGKFYQCGLDSQFRNVRKATHHKQTWKRVVVQKTNPALEAAIETEAVFGKLLKAKFHIPSRVCLHLDITYAYLYIPTDKLISVLYTYLCIDVGPGTHIFLYGT